jgi:hypothetical protein
MCICAYVHISNSYLCIHIGHKKSLTWMAKVVTIEDYVTAKEESTQLSKERKRCDSQRAAMRYELIGSIGCSCCIRS